MLQAGTGGGGIVVDVVDVVHRLAMGGKPGGRLAANSSYTGSCVTVSPFSFSTISSLKDFVHPAQPDPYGLK